VKRDRSSELAALAIKSCFGGQWHAGMQVEKKKKKKEKKKGLLQETEKNRTRQE